MRSRPALTVVADDYKQRGDEDKFEASCDIGETTLQKAGIRINSSGVTFAEDKAGHREDEDDIGECVVVSRSGRKLIALDKLETCSMIGRGSSDQVFKARHCDSNVLYAVKVVTNVFDKPRRDQLLTEIRTLYGIESEHLVGFYGAYFQDHALSLVLEFCALGSLDQLLGKLPKGEEVVPERVIAAIAMQVLTGLAHLKHVQYITSIYAEGHMEKIAETNDEETTQIVSFAPYNVDGRVHIDSHCLNAAIARMASHAGALTDAQIRHHYQQSQQILQQQEYVDNRVQHVRAEVNARNEEIAHFIRQNHVDSAAIDNHINIKLQAALDEARQVTAASNQILFQKQAASFQAMEDRLKMVEAASTQVKACVEQQANAQHDMEKRLSAAFSVVKAEAAENTEQRPKELLGAYFKHHAAQTKAAIAIETENSEKRVADRLDTFEDQINSRVEMATKQTEKKARAAVRRHLANEKLGLDDLKESLLKAIAEAEEKAVARANAGAKKILNELVTRQLEDAAMLGISAVGHLTAMTSSLPTLPIHPVSPPAPPTVAALSEIDNDSSDEDMDSDSVMPTADEFIAVDTTNPPSVSIKGKKSPASQSKQQIIEAEQGKVAARVLKRCTALKQAKNAKTTTNGRTAASSRGTATQQQPARRTGLTTRECVGLALQLAEKRKAARKAKHN